MLFSKSNTKPLLKNTQENCGKQENLLSLCKWFLINSFALNADENVGRKSAHFVCLYSRKSMEESASV